MPGMKIFIQVHLAKTASTDCVISHFPSAQVAPRWDFTNKRTSNVWYRCKSNYRIRKQKLQDALVAKVKAILDELIM